jgi:uncharacterized protein (DUF58 family)
VTPDAGLAPEGVEAQAQSIRFGIAFGLRFFGLLAAGCLWLALALVAIRFLYTMIVWDALLVAAWMLDARRLPHPATLRAGRTWSAPLALSVPATVNLTLVNDSNSAIRANVLDAMPRQLRKEPPSIRLTVSAHSEGHARYDIVPGERGPLSVGGAYIRYQSRLGLAERWSRAPIAQEVVVYPNLGDARRESVYLVRSRQIEMERRSQRIRSMGRSFESLREYRDGDEFRDICWTASARRGKLVTRLYESERSQPIWIVVDSGRLMRGRVNRLTKIDLAVNAALALSQVALGSGDRVGLLAYGRRIDHRLPATRGSGHLRRIIEHLAMVSAAEAEADHLLAASRLLADQKRRSLIVWMTDVPDTAMTPEVVTAAATLMPRHVVVFVVVGQPDLQVVAARKPETAHQMFETAAAQEVAHRRDLLLARLRARGALAVEARSAFSPMLVNLYLELKQRNRL